MLSAMHPETRVRFVIETARAVLDERLPADEAAAAVLLQAEQITPHLRSDRDAVTRSEAESVATILRLLAEQVNDRASGFDDDHAAPYVEMARAIGTMAQALR